MPLVLYDTQAEYDGVYKIRIRDPAHPKFGQKLSYTREAMARSKGPYDDTMTEYIDRFNVLISLFPTMAQSDRIIFAGSGLGFTLEPFIDAGFTNIWGLDNSTYINSIKGVEARGDVVIIDETFRNTPQLSVKLTQITGSNQFDWIVTESVLESYDDGAEMDEILDVAELGLFDGLPLSNIIHMVYPLPGIGIQFNRKTMFDWRAIRDEHSWVDYTRGFLAGLGMTADPGAYPIVGESPQFVPPALVTMQAEGGVFKLLGKDSELT